MNKALNFRLRLLAVCFGLLILVSLIDYVTSYDLLFFVFYFAPVCLCAWNLSLRETLMMAVVCALAWFVVDVAEHHPYSHPAYRYWNALVCFVAFASIGFALNRLHQSLTEQSRARAELSKTLEELQHSTREIQKLRDNIQVVCAWTKRIKVDGKWIPFDQFLSSSLHVKVSHGVSPEAFEIQMKNLAKDLAEGDQS